MGHNSRRAQVRLAVCGSHSTGKSTLAAAAAAAIGCSVIIGGLVRELIQEGYRFGRQTDLPSVMEYACRQFSCEDQAAESGARLVLSDRTLLDAVAYVTTNQQCDGCEKWLPGHLRFLRAVARRQMFFYDAIVYLPVEFKMISDGTRPQGDAYQQAVDDHLRKAIAELVQLPVFRLSGTLDDRVAQLIQHVAELSDA